VLYQMTVYYVYNPYDPKSRWYYLRGKQAFLSRGNTALK